MDPYLLTPGPLTTSLRTKQAMLKDWGSWDEDFHVLTQSVSDYLLSLIDGKESFSCVLMQGSGTFSVEASFGTLLPPHGKVLVLMNGLYGQRARQILEYMKKDFVVLDSGDAPLPAQEEIEKFLLDNPDISHVFAVHCETTTGILNPLKDIGELCKKHRKIFIIDAMSSFGALPLTCHDVHYDAIISSANKCLEGVPGFAFVLVRTEILVQCEGRSPSLSLDLYAQWQGFSKAIKWRFTPPTHVVCAFMEALKQHAEEGGCNGRLERYQQNYKILIEGMRSLGFKTLIEDRHMSPIIVTFLAPSDPGFSFNIFYAEMKKRGFIIYPGKLTEVPSFRIGCIGQIFPETMKIFVKEVAHALVSMRVLITDL